MWYYKNKVIDSLEKFPENATGFIYKITDIDTGQYYVGKKSLYSERSKKLTKKEIALQSGPGRKPTKKKVKKESDWLSYWSSHDVLKIKGKNEPYTLKREILEVCYSKTELTYKEVKWQCKLEVLEDEKSMNDNILGKFYRKNILPV